MKPIIRYTGSPDSSPEQWLRINHLTEQPGPGSAYRVTIEKVEQDWKEPVASEVLDSYKRAIDKAFDYAAKQPIGLGTEDAK